MCGDHDMRHEWPEHGPAAARRVPLCYSQKARSQSVQQVRADTQATVALATLSLFTCVAIFMVVYGRWGI